MASAAQFDPFRNVFGSLRENLNLGTAGAGWGLGTYFGADLVLIGVTSLTEDCEIWRLQII